MNNTELAAKLKHLPSSIKTVVAPEMGALDVSNIESLEIVYVEKGADSIENFWDESDFNDLSEKDPSFASTLEPIVVIWTTQP